MENCNYCSQFAHYKDEMHLHAQRAFGVNPDRHYRLLHAAAEEKPKIVVLSVIVLEAENLEAKDANGEWFLKFFILILKALGEMNFNILNPILL